MKREHLLFLVGAIVFPITSTAQQKTTADIISEGFNRGKAIRQAADERRARAAAQREATIEREFQRANTKIDLVLRSKNELPDIELSSSPVSICVGKSQPAFTRDASNNLIPGCAVATDTTLEVEWLKYGRRSYDLSEWVVTGPDDPDSTPLGG